MVCDASGAKPCLVRPGPAHLDACCAALKTGWSPNNLRPDAARGRAREPDGCRSHHRPGQVASIRVIEKAGGTLVSRHARPSAPGQVEELLLRILLCTAP